MLTQSWHRYLGGQFWVGYGYYYWSSPSMISFLRDACGLTLGAELDECVDAIIDLGASCCWVWPHKDFVMMCERPRVIARDDRGRLHREDGPACEFRDGWGVYAWHGVRVPARVIEHPETITPADINNEPNAEIRRVMLQRFGYARYVEEVGARVLHEDIDPLGFPRALYEIPAKSRDDLPIIIVKATNSTPEPDGTRKLYHLRCHHELRPLLDEGLGAPQKMTCLNAIASLSGLRGEEYVLEQET